MDEKDFAQMSIENLEQLIAELEAESLNNGIIWNWHENHVVGTLLKNK